MTLGRAATAPDPPPHSCRRTPPPPLQTSPVVPHPPRGRFWGGSSPQNEAGVLVPEFLSFSIVSFYSSLVCDGFSTAVKIRVPFLSRVPGPARPQTRNPLIHPYQKFDQRANKYVLFKLARTRQSGRSLSAPRNSLRIGLPG